MVCMKFASDYDQMRERPGRKYRKSLKFYPKYAIRTTQYAPRIKDAVSRRPCHLLYPPSRAQVYDPFGVAQDRLTIDYLVLFMFLGAIRVEY